MVKRLPDFPDFRDKAVTTKLMPDLRVVISEREVLRYQGYKETSPLKDNVARILAEEIEEGYRLIQPQALYHQVPVVGIDNRGVKLEGGEMLSLGSLAEDFHGSSDVGIAICTIGQALSERVSELFATQNFAEALMLDSVGSVAVESLADAVNYSLCQQADRLNMRAGTRSSPGYGGWNLEEQRVLFRLCDGAKIGVSLNDQCMMVPRKSISFCLGIGGKLVGDTQRNRCHRCHMKECQYRKEEKG